jgi:hypothetical protein
VDSFKKLGIKQKLTFSSVFILLFSDRRNSFDQGQRRRAASLSTPHRASDIQVDPVMSAALFREVRGVSQHIFLCVDKNW